MTGIAPAGSPYFDYTAYSILGYGTKTTTPYHKMDQPTFQSYMQNVKSAGIATELDEIEALSKAYSTGKAGASSFEDAFSYYDVTTHVGNANISDENWQRNDFPIWKYFDKNASADCLNNWKPSGPNPPQSDPSVQRGLSSIGPGKMSVIIPEALQKKMDADEDFAREIMEKVQKWKEDYDNWDNAAAVSLGMDPYEHQASKNYLINLDEEGNVKQYAVSGGGGSITKSDDGAVEEYQKRKKKEAEHRRYLKEEALRKEALERSCRESAEIRLRLEMSDNQGQYYYL